MATHLHRFLKDESGQAIMEFILLLLVVVSIVGILKTSIRSVTVRLWTFLGKRIAAPCASCDAGDDFNI